MIAAESTPNVSVRHAADVAPILNLVDVEITDSSIQMKLKKYYQDQKHYQLVVKKLVFQRYIKFSFQKNSLRKYYGKLIPKILNTQMLHLLSNQKPALALLQENNSDDETMQSNDASESESGE